jgi:hypothetical protein
MNNRYLCRLLVWGVALLLIMGLDSCQRASYSFQPIEGNSGIIPDPIVESALIPSQLAVVSAEPEPQRIANCKVRTSVTVSKSFRTLGRNNIAQFRLADKLKQAPKSIASRPAFKAHAAQHLQLPTTERYRSRSVAMLLGLLLGLLGAHQFYLGRADKGFLYLGFAVLSFFLYSAAVSITTIAGITPIASFIFATTIATVLVTQTVFDIIRIAKGQLKPQNGEYYPRFFQIRPVANSSHKAE